MRYPVSGSGYGFQYRNAGTIRNRGLEVSVSAVILEKAKYGLNFNANIAFNRSRIMDLAGLETYSQKSGWNNNVVDYYESFFTGQLPAEQVALDTEINDTLIKAIAEGTDAQTVVNDLIAKWDAGAGAGSEKAAQEWYEANKDMLK